MMYPLKKLSALLLALALSLTLTVPALAAEAALPPADAALSYGQASQLAWAVWQDGTIVESGRRGGPREDSDAGHLAGLERSAAGDHTVYGIGSVSKIYTTVAVMQLAEQGKLELDKPVTAYLPAFKMADPRYRDITVRMLLNHSSGLMGSSMGSALLFDDASTVAVDSLLERLAPQRLKADPGAYSVYCNDGFTLAQLVVEAVSGMDFPDYLRARVLKPAGLEKTYFPEEIVSGAAAAEGVVPTYQGEDSTPTPVECLGIVGTGGMFATAEDLARFGGTLTGETLLKEASLDAMAAPEYAKGLWPEGGPDALAYGLGWDSVEWYPFSQSGITALVKGGDTLFYHAGLVVLPEHQMAAAVVSSGGVSTYNEMAASQLLIAALEAKGVTVDQSPLQLPEAQPAAMPGELTALSGYYGSLYTYQIRVTEDGKLTMHYLNVPGAADQTFTYYSDGSFRDEQNTIALYLVEEDNGRVYLKQRTFTDVPGLGGLPGCSYVAQRLPEREISQELAELWYKRMSETVLVPMNERYSSQVYPTLAASFAAEVLLQATGLESAPGYTASLEIVDENHARYIIQVPGSMGRDGYDLEFKRDERGVLWMYQSNGSVSMDVRGVPTLSTGKENAALCTIQPDGYARWYRVGEQDAGKIMTVRLPEEAGFWVFRSTGVVSASSVLGKDTSVKLEAGDLIAFAGNPGAKFHLLFS